MRFYIFLCCLGISFTAGAQFNPDSKGLKQLVTSDSDNEFLYFNDSSRINEAQLILGKNQLLGLSNDDQLIFGRNRTDKAGAVHSRYQHYYKGFRVMFSELISHSKAGVVNVVNGHLRIGLNRAAGVAISENAAYVVALSNFHNSKFDWQMPETPGDLTVSGERPRGELVWIQRENAPDIYALDQYVLAYKFDIVTIKPDNAKAVYVDAATGRMIRTIQLMATCNATTVNTAFNGSQSLSTVTISGGFRLNNDCNPAFLETVNWNYNTYYQRTGTNTWTADTMRSAASTLWAMEKTYQYFKTLYNYKSWANGEDGLRSYTNALFCYDAGCTPSDPNNASFYRGSIRIGWGNTADIRDDWNCIDILGHEFTHGISDTMAHLVYANESGALNESFSDIFGNNVEFNVEGNTSNLWKMGEDRVNASNQTLWIRDMANPRNANINNNDTSGQPDTYKGIKWYPGTGDNGGVHTNSGVQNYMYYLLANGGSGTNDYGWQYSVTSLGIYTAQDLAFSTLVDYMDPNSTHKTARGAWLAAAANSYGAGSSVYKAVANAWYALGVCENSGIQSITECGATNFAYNTDIFGFRTINLANGCNYTINPGAGMVNYKAGTVIYMRPGFTATSGSNFKAGVSGCNAVQ